MTLGKRNIPEPRDLTSLPVARLDLKSYQALWIAVEAACKDAGLLTRYDEAMASGGYTNIVLWPTDSGTSPIVVTTYNNGDHV